MADSETARPNNAGAPEPARSSSKGPDSRNGYSGKLNHRALSWKRAAAIAWRDLKSAPGKFGFVVLSVAIGVAALVGVRGFSESFRRTLSSEARSLIAGDLSARIFHVPTPDDNRKID